MIEIVIPGEPCAQGRPRFARRGKFMVAYDPAKSRTWKATAHVALRDAMAGAGPLQGPLSVEIAATFTCPASEHRKREPMPRRWHAKRPDVENVVKAVLDAGTGVIFLDDNQVTHLVAVKVIGAQGEAPRLWMQVKPIVETPA